MNLSRDDETLPKYLIKHTTSPQSLHHYIISCRMTFSLPPLSEYPSELEMSPGSSVVTTVDVVNNFSSSKQHIRSASGTVLTDHIEEILKQVLDILSLILCVVKLGIVQAWHLMSVVYRLHYTQYYVLSHDPSLSL